MFEFSFPALLVMGLAGILVYHLYAKKIMGWVTPEEAALKSKLALIEHRLGITETALNPPTAAPVTPAALVPSAPAAPASQA